MVSISRTGDYKPSAPAPKSPSDRKVTSQPPKQSDTGQTQKPKEGDKTNISQDAKSQQKNNNTSTNYFENMVKEMTKEGKPESEIAPMRARAELGHLKQDISNLDNIIKTSNNPEEVKKAKEEKLKLMQKGHDLRLQNDMPMEPGASQGELIRYAGSMNGQGDGTESKAEPSGNKPAGTGGETGKPEGNSALDQMKKFKEDTGIMKKLLKEGPEALQKMKDMQEAKKLGLTLEQYLAQKAPEELTKAGKLRQGAGTAFDIMDKALSAGDSKAMVETGAGLLEKANDMAAKNAGKEAAEGGAKLAAKEGLKIAGKDIGKYIPFLGYGLAAYSTGEAANETRKAYEKGDTLGMIEKGAYTVSNAAAFIPGPGTVISIAGDVAEGLGTPLADWIYSKTYHLSKDDIDYNKKYGPPE